MYVGCSMMNILMCSSAKSFCFFIVEVFGAVNLGSLGIARVVSW